jgi:hypothetical protein
LYLPLNRKFFKIAFVEHESVFYQTGALQVFDMKCELFEFSGERFETGSPSIDTFFDSIRTDTITTLTGLNDSDPIAKNIFFEQEADDIIDFSEIDPFSEVIRRPKDNNAIMADSTVLTSDSVTLTADIN